MTFERTKQIASRLKDLGGFLIAKGFAQKVKMMRFSLPQGEIDSQSRLFVQMSE